MLEHVFPSTAQVAANTNCTFTPVQIIRGQFKACVHAPERENGPVFTISRLMPDYSQIEYDSYTLSGLSTQQLKDLSDLLIEYADIVEYDPFSDLFTRLKLDCQSERLPQNGKYQRSKDYSEVQNSELNITIQDVEPETLQEYLDHIAQQRITVSREDTILSLNLPFHRHSGSSVSVTLLDGQESVWEGLIIPACPDTYVHREAPVLADALVEAFQKDGIESATEHLQLHGVENGMTLLKSKKVGAAQISVYQTQSALTVRFVLDKRVILNFKKEVKSKQDLKKLKREVLKRVAGLTQRIEDVPLLCDFLEELESHFDVTDRIVHYRKIVDTAQRLFRGKNISGLNLLVDIYESSVERWSYAVYGLNKYELSPVEPKAGLLNTPDKLTLSVNKRLEGTLEFVNLMGAKRTYLLDSILNGTDQALRIAALNDCIAQFRSDPLQSVSLVAYETGKKVKEHKYLGIVPMQDSWQIACIPYLGLPAGVVEQSRGIFEYAYRLFDESRSFYLEKHNGERPPFYITQDAIRGVNIPIYMGKHCCLIMSIKPKSYLVPSNLITQLSLKSSIPRWFGRGHKEVLEKLAAPPRFFLLPSIERLMEELYTSEEMIDTADQLLQSEPLAQRSIKKLY